MAEESDLERSEAPSPRRLEQAREEGQVARSREFSAFAVLMAGAAGLWFSGAQLFDGLSRMMAHALRTAPLVADEQLMTVVLARQSLETWWLVAPLLIALLLAAFAAPLGLSGWLFTPKPLLPDFSRLNPLTGIMRMFSGHALTELGKALAKVLVIGAVAVGVIASQLPLFSTLIAHPLESGIVSAGRLVMWCFAVIAGSMILIVAVDVPMELWRHFSKLRMSLEEVKKEAKETEGDPAVKAAVRGQQREMARRRMMADVPGADVVVTNPTHYAVALSYSDGSMRAPRVVAKGAELVAMRIREIARENHVPVLESPPLARALYRHAEIGDEIPETLYAAVAEVLAYVFQLRHYHSRGGPAPKPPMEIAVPPALDPGAGTT